MRLKFRWLLIVPVLLFSACSQNGNIPAAPAASNRPPTPFADTPAPAKIDALLIEAPAPVKLYMLNELEGWGVMEAQIARTNDGGLHWYNVTPPDVAETGYSVDTFVLDINHAWVQKPDFDKFPASGTLYRTTDGGLTWTSSTVPFSRGDLSFVDAKNGWVLADLGAAAGSNAVAVYRTADGGVTWERAFTNDPNDAEAADSLPLGGIKSDLVPLNATTAWVTGVVYAPGEIYLYRTDDGGHTWNKVSMKLPAGAENSELGIDRDAMKFVSARDGFLVLRISGESTQSTVYLTQDGGETWIPTAMTLPGAGESVFLSPQDAVLYNGEQFYITRDAARTWVTVSPDIAFGESFAGMDFVNPSMGWAVSLDPTTNHRSLYRTTDGGTTWSPVLP